MAIFDEFKDKIKAGLDAYADSCGGADQVCSERRRDMDLVWGLVLEASEDKDIIKLRDDIVKYLDDMVYSVTKLIRFLSVNDFRKILYDIVELDRFSNEKIYEALYNEEQEKVRKINLLYQQKVSEKNQLTREHVSGVNEDLVMVREEVKRLQEENAFLLTRLSSFANEKNDAVSSPRMAEGSQANSKSKGGPG